MSERLQVRLVRPKRSRDVIAHVDRVYLNPADKLRASEPPASFTGVPKAPHSAQNGLRDRLRSASAATDMNIGPLDPASYS